jgi:hypothetical protein
MPPLSTSSLTQVPPPPGNEPAGECSRLVMENPLPPHLGTRLTGPMPDKCLVHPPGNKPTNTHWSLWPGTLHLDSKQPK